MRTRITDGAIEGRKTQGKISSRKGGGMGLSLQKKSDNRERGGTSSTANKGDGELRATAPPGKT